MDIKKTLLSKITEQFESKGFRCLLKQTIRNDGNINIMIGDTLIGVVHYAFYNSTAIVGLYKGGDTIEDEIDKYYFDYSDDMDEFVSKIVSNKDLFYQVS